VKRLAPLNPDAYLAWQWSRGPRAKGTHPLTVADYWFDLARVDPSVSIEEVRRLWLHQAARVRASQRLGEAG
jgi:hypothetical protein